VRAEKKISDENNAVCRYRDSGHRLTACKSTSLRHSRIRNLSITLQYFCFQFRLWLLYNY